MNRTVRLSPQSYQYEMDDLKDKVCQGVNSRGTWIGTGRNNLTIRRAEFIGDAGVRLVLKNGMEIEDIEMIVMYQS